MSLKIQDSYDFITVITPVVLMDNNQLVEAYVDADVERRKQLVSLFDRWASLRPNQFTENLRSQGIDVTNRGSGSFLFFNADEKLAWP